MGPSIFNRDEQHCSVCGLPMQEELQTREAQERAFLGAAAYAWCPCCGRQVEPPWDAAYKARWARAFADWVRSQEKRGTRQARPVTVGLTSADGKAMEVTLAATESSFELRWLLNGELQAVERFASRESGLMRLQEIERAFRSQGYRSPGEPGEQPSGPDMKPVDLWTLTLPDGRSARATAIPMRGSVTLALLVDDRVEDVRDYGDLESAMRAAAELRAAMMASRRES